MSDTPAAAKNGAEAEIQEAAAALMFEEPSFAERAKVTIGTMKAYFKRAVTNALSPITDFAEEYLGITFGGGHGGGH